MRASWQAGPIFPCLLAGNPIQPYDVVGNHKEGIRVLRVRLAIPPARSSQVIKIFLPAPSAKNPSLKTKGEPNPNPWLGDWLAACLRKPDHRFRERPESESATAGNNL